MLVFLVTVAPSEEIADWIWIVTAFCSLGAVVLAIAALGCSVMCAARRWLPLCLAGVTILLSLESLAYSYYVYQLDFVEVEMDGTKASGPLWKSLVWPAIPIVVAVLAGTISLSRRSWAGVASEVKLTETSF